MENKPDIKIDVDVTSLSFAVEKANQLVELLKEAESRMKNMQTNPYRNIVCGEQKDENFVKGKVDILKMILNSMGEQDNFTDEGKEKFLYNLAKCLLKMKGTKLSQHLSSTTFNRNDETTYVVLRF